MVLVNGTHEMVKHPPLHIACTIVKFTYTTVNSTHTTVNSAQNKFSSSHARANSTHNTVTFPTLELTPPMQGLTLLIL